MVAPNAVAPSTGILNAFIQNGNNQGVTNTQNTGAGINNTQQMNQYTDAQRALQSQLGTQIGGLISGTQQIPQNWMTAPQAAFDNLNNQLNNQVNPMLAAQYGAGSPQIGAQDRLAQTDLAARLYPMQMGFYQNLLGQAGQLAYNPIGANTQNQTNTQGLQNQQFNENTNQKGLAYTDYGPSLLGLLTKL